MKETLERLRYLREAAGRSALINEPASAEEIAEWEKAHSALIPQEIKEFLQFSNGFEYGWGAVVVFPLNKIRPVKNWDSVPDNWLELGSIIGDGAYMVSDENGELYLADHNHRDDPLAKFSLKEWLEESIFISIEEEYGVE